MLFAILFLLLGFLLVTKGADFLVDGASSLATKFNVSALVIGLTIVAFGTSLPELTVNIFSSLEGANELTIGNILGSNMANTLLILGVAGLICPLVLKRATVWKEIPFALLAVVVLGILANDKLFDFREFSQISRIDGFILIAFFIIFLVYAFGKERKEEEEEDGVKEYSLLISILFISAGAAALFLGGKWIVDSAVSITTRLGMSQSFVGLTIVAIGTSVPELATSAIAAYKKKPDIAIGNIIGSNIFNIFWVLGVSSLIRPIDFQLTLNTDVIILAVITLLLLVFIHSGRPHKLDRWESGILLGGYLAYIVFLFYRG